MESKQWTLTERELATLVQTNRLTISSASPLAATIRRLLTGDGPLFPKSIEPDLRQAIEAVAQPHLEIGLLLSPPHGNNINWFYSGGKGQTDGLAGYRMANDSYQFVWTSEQELIAEIRSCLQLDVPTDGGAFSLDLSVSAYQTFLSLVDCNRERTLESLLKRSPDSERYFTVNRVFETFMRNCRSDDWRWLVALARAISPFDFRLNEAECEKGLRDIADRGLLEKYKDGWRLSPSMQLICTTLSSPLGYCAMHRRRFVSTERSEQENLIALRCMGTLWLIQFARLNSSDLRVRFKDASGEDLELIISEKLHDWTPGSQPQMAPTPSQAEQRSCPSCGSEVAADFSFCPKCGSRVLFEAGPLLQNSLKKGKTEVKAATATQDKASDEGKRKPADVASTGARPASSAPTSDVKTTVSARQVGATSSSAALRCPNTKCGRSIPVGKKFCTACGTRVAEVEQSPSLESTTAMPQPTPRERRCPKCKKIVPVGKKFCTADGTPVP